MYQSMASLIDENKRLTAQLRGGSVTEQLWSQFEALRPLADACDLTGYFDGCIATRSETALDELSRKASHLESKQAVILEDIAQWMSTMMRETRALAHTTATVRKYLAAGQEALR